MAKIVIAGAADCPYYAKVELLGDDLGKNLPDFQLHKIVVKRTEWDDWLKKTCQANNWEHTKSPLVWRELVNRGGKGLLIGGANEFQEFARGYYNLKSKYVTDDMLQFAKENEKFKIDIDQEFEELRAKSNPTVISITNSNGPVCYNMLAELAKGQCLGHKTEINIRLYDPENEATGPAYETEDLATANLKYIDTFTNLHQAFMGAKIVVLLDEVSKEEDESKNSWLKRNYELFAKYGQILNEVADPSCKVILSGNGPLNFNTHSVIKNAPKLLRQNIVAVSRLVENQAKAILGKKMKVNSANVVDVVVWGNINEDKYVDTSKTRVHQYEGAIWGPPQFSLPISETLHDNKWLVTEFPGKVKEHDETVSKSMGHRPAMSEGSAISSLLNHFTQGSPVGQIYSLGVCSKGEYEVPEGLVFSMPVTFSTQGYWIVAEDIDLSDDVKDKIKSMVKELQWEIEAPGREDPPVVSEQDITQKPAEEHLPPEQAVTEEQMVQDQEERLFKDEGSQAGSEQGSRPASVTDSKRASPVISNEGSGGRSNAGSAVGSRVGSRAGSASNAQIASSQQQEKQVFGEEK